MVGVSRTANVSARPMKGPRWVFGLTATLFILCRPYVVVKDLPHPMIGESNGERAPVNRCYSTVSELGMVNTIAYGEGRFLCRLE
jgi:hypothetical protein